METKIANSDLRRIRNSSTLIELSQTTVALARKTIGCEGVTFVLREHDMSYYFDEDAIEPLWKGSKFPLGSCISGWVMNYRETCVIPDILVDDRVPQSAYKPTFVKSLLMVPLGRSSPIGALGAYWKTQHAATPEEIFHLEKIADSVFLTLYSILQIKTRSSSPAPDFIDANAPALLGRKMLVATTSKNVIESTRLSSYLSAHGAEVLQLEVQTGLALASDHEFRVLLWNHQHENGLCRWQREIESVRNVMGSSVKFIHLLDGSCDYNESKVDGSCLVEELLDRYLLSDLAFRIAQTI